GEATANAATRVEARASPVAQPGSREISIGSQSRDRCPQRPHPGHHLAQHPRSGQEEDEGCPDQLGDEGEGHLLHLGDRLQQRHGDPDAGGGNEERPRELGRDHEGVDEDVEDLGIRHATVPCTDLTSDWMIRDQPSTSTKSNSLRGRLTKTGGSIIMPSDISTADTTRSMTRNGTNTMNPIRKAVRSSETT